MTLIAAAVCGDHLLFATDSQVTERNGLATTFEKPSQRTDHPLVWGFSGDEGIGMDFHQWMSEYQISPEASWRSVADAASEQLSRLNGRKRERAFLARVEPKSDDLASVLLAGFVGGVLDIWELDDRGGATSVARHQLYGIGSGWPHAAMVFLTVKRMAPKMPPLDQSFFAVVMELGIKHSDMCDFPLRMLKVTADGVTEVVLVHNTQRPPDTDPVAT